MKSLISNEQTVDLKQCGWHNYASFSYISLTWHLKSNHWHTNVAYASMLNINKKNNINISKYTIEIRKCFTTRIWLLKGVKETCWNFLIPNCVLSKIIFFCFQYLHGWLNLPVYLLIFSAKKINKQKNIWIYCFVIMSQICNFQNITTFKFHSLMGITTGRVTQRQRYANKHDTHIIEVSLLGYFALLISAMIFWIKLQ